MASTLEDSNQCHKDFKPHKRVLLLRQRHDQANTETRGKVVKTQNWKFPKHNTI
jgi:hypothetical protein